ncbi:Protein of unknown function [Chitinophaga costaii]|uniref:DUF3347 domain-containing protein n=1 Tax=Chitinophaga costaii TaxID=1335309 RepID=A0A1C4FIS4_9BACT|nr:DUF3347 domain-containing protein [Chitinophaga costaii]PUZ20279.1 DUF3347 domain-containing protein [Chitinophaga costaii]SCC55361.1 Protein of unknown function [Chitinophaga costaii]
MILRPLATGMLLATMLVLSCQHPQPTAATQERNLYKAPFAAVFYDSLQEVLVAYDQLRNALAREDTAAANAAARRMQQKLDSLPLKTLAMNSDSLKRVEGSTGSISAELDGLAGESTLADKRDAFFMVSDMCLDLVQLTGWKGSTLYRISDSGTANKTGAYWLSETSSGTENPYTGKRSTGTIITDTLHFHSVSAR